MDGPKPPHDAYLDAVIGIFAANMYPWKVRPTLDALAHIEGPGKVVFAALHKRVVETGMVSGTIALPMPDDCLPSIPGAEPIIAFPDRFVTKDMAGNPKIRCGFCHQETSVIEWLGNICPRCYRAWE